VKILFLAQRVPYPPNRGDKISTWNMIERMRRSHEVRVVAFAHDREDLDAARELERRGYAVRAFPFHPRWARIRSLPLLLTRKPLTMSVYGSNALQAEVLRQGREVDLGYAYSSSMSAFLLPLEGVARVNHIAELDSDKWRQYAGYKRFPMSWLYRREWRTLEAVERKICHAVEANVLCTSVEERIFRERIPGAESVVIRNGVDLRYYRPSPQEAEPGRLVFVGVMDYYPNVEGCLWFAHEILPRIRERCPEARLSIVGSRPAPEIRRLARIPGVEVTGFVDDPREWLRRAAVSIAPMRIARGVQNKVLEAMAMGLAVVGTRAATQGVEGRAGRDFLEADDVAGQVEAICGLLRDSGRARELGSNARRFVEEAHDWEKTLAVLDETLERLQPKT